MTELKTPVERLIRIPTTLLTPSVQNLITSPFTSQYGAPVSQLKLKEFMIVNPLGTNVLVTLYDIVYTSPTSYTYFPVVQVLVSASQTTVEFIYRDDNAYIFGGGLAVSAQFTGVYLSAVVEVE
ncbi:MAG: hypothetical protein L7H00_01225 [Vulcanisaeta sp.]|nr:hypothetical protein [Vulcanisaeta sp.]